MNEKIHWSVPDLLFKKLVRRCKPLEKLDHNYATAECSEFERSLIETWASKDCLGVTLDIIRRGEHSQDKEEDSCWANFVPTYAVLLKPEKFGFRRERVAQSTLEVRPKHGNGASEEERKAGDPIPRSAEPSFKSSRMFKTEDDWVLSGSIEVPAVSALDAAG